MRDLLLADTSVWSKRHRFPPLIEEWFAAAIRRRRIACCDAVRLELLWSARDVEGFRETRSLLAPLPDCPITPETYGRAMDVFERLAARGPLHHRQVKLPDLLIAAAAERPT